MTATPHPQPPAPPPPVDLDAFNGHTPGPWTVGNNYGVVTGGPDLCTSVAETTEYLWRNCGVEEMVRQGSANGRLIAAAPALLAECRRQRAELHAQRAEIERLRAALADLSAAIRPVREGKRDGGTFGSLSIADDAARAALNASGGKS